MTVARRTARRAAIAGLVSALAAAVTTTIVVVGPPGHAAPPQPPRAHVWVTTPDGAERMHDRGTVAFAQGAGSDRLTITVDSSCATRRWTDSGRRSPTRRRRCCRSSPGHPQRDDARPVRHRRAVVPAAADGLLRLRRRPALHLRRHAARRDRLRARPLLDRPRQGRDPAAAPAGPGPQPRPQGDGDAVEPAGLDEDQRLAGRRPADRRPPDLPGVRRLPGQVRAGLRGGRGSGLGPHHPERAAEPHPVGLPRHRPAYPAGDPGDRPARPGAGRRRPAHQDHGLRPQLVRASQRHRQHPARGGPGDGVPHLVAAVVGRPLAQRHGVPLLRRRPEADDRAPPRLPGQERSGSPSAPAPTARATRRPRCSATP